MMSRTSALLVIALLGLAGPRVAAAAPFDFDNGNAGVEIVIPAAVPVIFGEVSPTGGDATLVLRITTLITNAWFDATAPYHPSAVGVYSHLPRRPAAEAGTNRNLNIALLYASKQVLSSLLPGHEPRWQAMLADVGLDPADASTDLTTATGIGNVAGTAVVVGREDDGMNQIGDADGRLYNPMPYMDYTGYAPVNTAYELRDPSRWQPDLQRQGMGLYKVQQFVTPQYALVEPYAYLDPKAFHVPKPKDSDFRRRQAYRDQADVVLQASADLDDERKMLAELFDNKIASLGFSVLFTSQSRGLGLREFIELDFLTNMAAFDAGIVMWQEKRRYDTVRPYSAIRHLYGNQRVTAWGGPGAGTVFDLPGNEWKSYLEEADHPEYPSGSACFCAAHAQAARLYLNSDSLGWTVPQPVGSSRVEPGITPATDLALSFPTWTAFAADCGQSRVWAGVHFQAAVDESAALCPVFGEMAHDYLLSLNEGTAALRPPSRGLQGVPH